jgi:glutamyl-Q tRNA(Asp) synthetase
MHEIRVTTYRGRFAPTPSGPLHLGSLLTALASYLQARACGGAWLLRIDDLDAPRCPPGAADTILRQLESHGFSWDEAPRYQSQHLGEYELALERLRRTDLLYACECTRAELAATSRPGLDGPVYAATCRGRHIEGPRVALRFRAGSSTVEVDDDWQGKLVRDVARDIGDFVVRRADGQIGYQLACVVDEQAQAISEIVRGADLIGSSLRQQLLRPALGLAPIATRHVPIVLDEHGRKLSKQNHASPIVDGDAAKNLVLCLSRLGQEPPPELSRGSVLEVISWGIAHWRPDQVPRGKSLS